MSSAAPGMKKFAWKVHSDLSNYSSLRDPVTWGSKSLWASNSACDAGCDVSARLEAMLGWQSDRLGEPLTDLEGDVNLEQKALKNFGEILRCMGDKPSCFSADKEGPIVKRGHGGGLLLDEIYMQIMKQL